MRAPRDPRRHGFSLVELLIAMLVFAILAALAVSRYRAMRERGYLAEMKTDLGNLRIAEEAHWADEGHYTVDQSLLDYRSGSRVTITITSPDPFAGFDAEAVHSGAPQIRCRMYVGRMVSGTPSGEARCQ